MTLIFKRFFVENTCKSCASFFMPPKKHKNHKQQPTKNAKENMTGVYFNLLTQGVICFKN